MRQGQRITVYFKSGNVKVFSDNIRTVVYHTLETEAFTGDLLITQHKQHPIKSTTYRFPKSEVEKYEIVDITYSRDMTPSRVPENPWTFSLGTCIFVAFVLFMFFGTNFFSEPKLVWARVLSLVFLAISILISFLWFKLTKEWKRKNKSSF